MNWDRIKGILWNDWLFIFKIIFLIICGFIFLSGFARFILPAPIGIDFNSLIDRLSFSVFYIILPLFLLNIFINWVYWRFKRGDKNK